MPLIDLSHTIDNNTVTYKGLPKPVICDYWTRKSSGKNYVDGSSFQIGKIEMVANTGTYIDCPFHRFENGKDISEVSLDAFANLESHKVRWDYQKQGLSVSKQAFEGINLKNKAILINTNWSEKWMSEEYYTNHPFLSEEAANYLKDSGVLLVGIDSYNIDDTRTKKRPVHTVLLGNEILIVEHLTNLSLLPDHEFNFTAVPPKIKGMGTFPVRAFAKI
ncbi:cyclase family protein [Mangrovivirga sp. M17]|uniref:Cyclase family protein n=1 Tax=Mangrovivirga halotolerans TaxID=2993936 RepID=A0ABT3RNJ1_9BACT|nr:cyclase family protein [Mangrovivirga halotolerans]MCX2742720.1 cyclase family protein [Mangrovivirga halotolerans]